HEKEECKAPCCKKHEKEECKDHGHKKHHKHYTNCVGEVLAAILAAEKKVQKKEECLISCKQSIQELLEEKKSPLKNTIPFIVYSKDCQPFKATGVTTYTSHSKEEKFICVTSYLFKIKELDKKCAVLELLAFKPKKKCCCRSHAKQEGNGDKPICSQVNHKNVHDLVKTGICINVNISSFSAITCLPAVYL
ncbi:CotY/CotZ family spore coat protein, partial [Niallia nealsonii]